MKTLIITIAFLVAVPVYGQVTEMTAVDSPVIRVYAHEISEVDEPSVSESTPRESQSSSGGRSERYTLLLQYIELLKAYIALLGR